MSIRLCSAFAALILALAPACSRDAQPLSPSVGPGGLLAVAGGIERVVSIFDACDPTTFNAVLGAGACTRNGGVSFQAFIDMLTTHQTAGPWHFAPNVLTMKEGQKLVAVNNGGETHTFTEVEEYGGGIVPSLNQLSGNPQVAPECTQLKPGDFLPPGARSSEVTDESGVEKYQCCIHPWMRAEVRIAAEK